MMQCPSQTLQPTDLLPNQWLALLTQCDILQHQIADIYTSITFINKLSTPTLDTPLDPQTSVLNSPPQSPYSNQTLHIKHLFLLNICNDRDLPDLTFIIHPLVHPTRFPLPLPILQMKHIEMISLFG
jgi:hypothetical protein